MDLHCTTKQAIEAVLASRGTKLEESDTFDLIKLLEYLSHASQFMPPVNNRRGLIRDSNTTANRMRSTVAGWNSISGKDVGRGQIRSQHSL